MSDPSANGTQPPGILWASLPLHDDAWIDIVRGSLRAFKITLGGNSITPIWTSYCAEKDDRFNFAKYVPPTVANGKVAWATTPFAANNNANAIRWGTLYNFRFDASLPATYATARRVCAFILCFFLILS